MFGIAVDRSGEGLENASRRPAPRLSAASATFAAANAIRSPVMLDPQGNEFCVCAQPTTDDAEPT